MAGKVGVESSSLQLSMLEYDFCQCCCCGCCDTAESVVDRLGRHCWQMVGQEMEGEKARLVEGISVETWLVEILDGGCCHLYGHGT